MSNTINLVLPFSDKNVELVKTLLSEADLIKEIKVVDAEVVETPAKAPAKKAPAKAPAKKAPEPEPEEEFELDEGEGAEESVTIDDIKLKQAEKVTAHREDIIKKLKSLGAQKGISDLPEENYQVYFDWLSKLK